MDLNSLARNIAKGAYAAEKKVPLYGQLQRGVRQTMAPVVGAVAGQGQQQKYEGFSQPEQPGMVNAAMRMAGQAAPIVPATMAAEGAAVPLIAKAVQANRIKPTVDLSKALQFMDDGGDAVKVIVDKAKTEPDSPQALTLLQKLTSQHLPQFKNVAPQEQADIWDSLMTAKFNPQYMNENPNIINPAIRPTIQSMYNRSRLK